MIFVEKAEPDSIGKGRESGFTLVEILAVVGLVIFIMGIMIAGYVVARKWILPI